MSWVLFDYGGVICYPQPAQDVERLAAAARCSVTEFKAAYWPYRLDYDRATLDMTAYWQRVAADLGQVFTDEQIQELSRLDIASWLHLQSDTVALIEDLAAAGHELAILSNAPADVAEGVSALRLASHFRRLVFSCFLKSAKPDPECFSATLNLLGAQPQDVTFLDDRPENVAGGIRMGLRCLRFTSADGARAELARLGIKASTR
ncbi:MAG TPA: HAD family phosphatase [Streptosporangiaceae bacterium]|nr:HAD family phosphatase [Streptosporangiaceae bacterium]